jgi:hypothetical protein
MSLVKVFACELVLSCVALERLTILVVSLESGTSVVCVMAGQNVAAWLVRSPQVPVQSGYANQEKQRQKSLKLPKSVRSLDTHVGHR